MLDCWSVPQTKSEVDTVLHVLTRMGKKRDREGSDVGHSSDGHSKKKREKEQKKRREDAPQPKSLPPHRYILAPMVGGGKAARAYTSCKHAIQFHTPSTIRPGNDSIAPCWNAKGSAMTPVPMHVLANEMVASKTPTPGMVGVDLRSSSGSSKGGDVSIGLSVGAIARSPPNTSSGSRAAHRTRRPALYTESSRRRRAQPGEAGEHTVERGVHVACGEKLAQPTRIDATRVGHEL